MALTNLAAAAAVFAASYAVYRRHNMGLAPTSRRQQFRRYLIATIVAITTVTAAGRSVAEPPTMVAALTALLWITTFNVLYDKTYRKRSPDYDNHIDIAFGIYLLGWLVGLDSLLCWLSPTAGAVAMSVIETVLMAIPVAQIGYYALYRTCIDNTGMQTILETNGNEVIEFVKSFSAAKLAALVTPLILTVAVCAVPNALSAPPTVPTLPFILTTVALTVFSTIYIWKPRHGLFVRTGIAMLYSDIKEYKRTNELYKQQARKRMERLHVDMRTPQTPQPHTVVMVIGESGCRDYMSAFVEQERETTPWESEMRQDESHFTFFDHAYSCAIQTVPSLEMALTEKNQYNKRDFIESCSIVDIAHKAGYHVHWYSNQGHIGSADTPVTLVAETADVAKWTKQEIGKAYYDSSLLDFLDEVDPRANNFVVLHLKGNHFNYTNRYTPEYAAENGFTEGDNVHNYKNSIHYTDHILKRIFDYATAKLHLAAMVYYSDHGAMPYARRVPRFCGFHMVRIPLWTYLSDSYKEAHPHVAKALKANSAKYFTNDLTYELMCGIFDICSDHYDEANSLASEKYNHTRDTLQTDCGRIKISDDEIKP